MKVAWATDIHLNFVDEETAATLCRRMRDAGCEALLLGGDIAEATDFAAWLSFLEARLALPIYFVLGNHDYYGSDVASVRSVARALSTESLMWLTGAGVVALNARTALVGHGGWGDAGYGDFESSEVILSDYVVIDDLRHVGPSTKATTDWLGGWSDKPALKRKLVDLGRDAADTLRPYLVEALEQSAHVYVLTHVPPFEESCWHDGKISNPDWLPGFSCRALGDLLREIVPTFPHREVTVLTGHTHGSGEAQVLENLRVFTQGASYGHPDFRVLEIAE